MDFRFLKMPAFRTDLHVKINVTQGSALSQSRASAVRPSFSSNRFRHSGFRRGGCGKVGIDALFGIRPVAFFAAVVRVPGVANGVPTIVTLGACFVLWESRKRFCQEPISGILPKRMLW